MPSPPNEPDDQGCQNAIGDQAADATLPPHLRQLALQGAAAFAVLSLAWPYFLLRDVPLPWAATTFVIGGVALLLALLTRQRWWWNVIHALFAPVAWWASTLEIAPFWFLVAFSAMLLVYRGAINGQIPLYLSNHATVRALVEMISESAVTRFADLGCGVGSVLCPLARVRPRSRFSGTENAFATWLIAYFRALGHANCDIRLGSFWSDDLSQYDIVYAFLSPAPMPDLWAKVEREMRPGSLFVSNSFAVPDVPASRIVDIGDTRRTRLYCYRR